MRPGADRRTAGTRTPGPAAALLLAMMLLGGHANARCTPFDLRTSTASVPYVVFGRVLQSNADQLQPGKCIELGCTHRFRVQVLERLKGSFDAEELQFEYQYFEQRPEVAEFWQGDERVFAIRSVAPDGTAELYGTVCWRSGLGAERRKAFL